ncbi:hypothetical protein ACVWYG_001480 [Pedobacter sp. UYEF25]
MVLNAHLGCVNVENNYCESNKNPLVRRSRSFKIEVIERLFAAADEILVKLNVSGVNPVDRVIRSGANESLRQYFILPVTLGWDAAVHLVSDHIIKTDFFKS